MEISIGVRALIIFGIVLAITGCTNDDIKPSKVSEIPVEVIVPKDEGSSLIVNSIPALPEPSNPSKHTVLLKQLKNTYSMYISREFVDTTVYHYNVNGEVVAEFSTYFSVGDSKIFSGYKKYDVNPENLNKPTEVYATVLTSNNNRTKVDFIYCDKQKRVTREVKDGVVSYSYEYDEQGRLSSKFNEYSKEVTVYSYFDRKEEENAYYLVQVFARGSTLPSHETKYILSNQVKSGPQLNYSFNYGKTQEYVVEREIANKESEYLFNYIIDNDRVSEKKFRVGQHDFWIKFVY